MCAHPKKGSQYERSFGGGTDINQAFFIYYDKNNFKEQLCYKSPTQFKWHEDVGRWIEKGREKEEKAKAKPKTKSKTKPDYVKEIKVLVDLLEDDTLTKEVFIKKIREKLK